MSYQSKSGGREDEDKQREINEWQIGKGEQL